MTPKRAFIDGMGVLVLLGLILVLGHSLDVKSNICSLQQPTQTASRSHISSNVNQSQSFLPSPEPQCNIDGDWTALSNNDFSILYPCSWKARVGVIQSEVNKRYFIQYQVYNSLSFKNAALQKFLQQNKLYEFQNARIKAVCDENGEGNCHEVKPVYIKNIVTDGIQGVEYSTYGPGLNLGEPRGKNTSIERLYLFNGKIYIFSTRRNEASNIPELKDQYPVLVPDELETFRRIMDTLRFNQNLPK